MITPNVIKKFGLTEEQYNAKNFKDFSFDKKIIKNYVYESREFNINDSVVKSINEVLIGTILKISANIFLLSVSKNNIKITTSHIRKGTMVAFNPNLSLPIINNSGLLIKNKERTTCEKKFRKLSNSIILAVIDKISYKSDGTRVFSKISPASVKYFSCILETILSYIVDNIYRFIDSEFDLQYQEDGEIEDPDFYTDISNFIEDYDVIIDDKMDNDPDLKIVKMITKNMFWSFDGFDVYRRIMSFNLF